MYNFLNNFLIFMAVIIFSTTVVKNITIKERRNISCGKMPFQCEHRFYEAFTAEGRLSRNESRTYARVVDSTPPH